MIITRRNFLSNTAAACAAAALLPKPVRAGNRAAIKVGACVVGLEAAKKAGLDGVQIGVGHAADKLDISKPETLARCKAQMQATGLPICSFMLGLLNNDPLATDPRGPAWLTQCIDAAKELGVSNLLIAFFGKGDLQVNRKIKEDEFASVVARLKDAAPRAKDAGVTLAVESMLNSDQLQRLLDAVNSDAVSIYYDVYNTGKTMRYDSPAEIRKLKGRITQFHYKNGPDYLDADKPYFEAVTAAINDIGYSGWIVLETSAPSKNGIADAKRNGDFVRALFA